MRRENKAVENLLARIKPVMLPAADYPPAVIVRDTPREDIIERIRHNAQKANLSLDDEHWAVIDFLFDFYSNCCEMKDPGYISQQVYWKYVDCSYDRDCASELDGRDEQHCPHGQLSHSEATDARRVYRILLRAFKAQGGAKHLYRLFPDGPLFTIHLLAGLPRLRNDADPHFGTAY